MSYGCMIRRSGVEVECTTIYGFTPLLAAVRYTNLQCVRALLQRNANLFAKDNRRKLSALLWAVEVRDPQILKVYHRPYVYVCMCLHLPYNNFYTRFTTLYQSFTCKLIMLQIVVTGPGP